MLKFAQHGFGIGHRCRAVEHALPLISLAKQVRSERQCQRQLTASLGAGKEHGVRNAVLCHKPEKPFAGFVLSYNVGKLHLQNLF